MIDPDKIKQAAADFRAPQDSFERLVRRRDRKRRNQRFGAAALAVVITVAGIMAVGQVIGSEPLPADPAPTPTIDTDASPTPTAETDASPNPRVDAIVTLARSGCTLRGLDDPIAPGTLTLRFVNESHWDPPPISVNRDALFIVVRFRPGRTVDNPGYGHGPLIQGGWGRWVGSAPSAETWSSPDPVVGGRWAVICWKDTIESPLGFMVESRGVAGPIRVR